MVKKYKDGWCYRFSYRDQFGVLYKPFKSGFHTRKAAEEGELWARNNIDIVIAEINMKRGNNIINLQSARLPIISASMSFEELYKAYIVDWVDALGVKWAEHFREALSQHRNYRGGPFHTGMYTVSAHVPMGEIVGASPDGRNACEPLADGGMSPVYGRDLAGPTAVLKSVSKLDRILTSNGGLLNMKFLPSFFETEDGIERFAAFLRTFVDLEIPHIQFNVVRREDLLEAKVHPEQHRSLTVRVAGYTAYFVELAGELQDEIIARTSYAGV